MSRADFKNKLLAYHADSQQNQKMVEMAINGLYEALDTLARYGHPLTVELPEDSAYQGDEFPKMLYNEQNPNGRVFHREDQIPTESGWRDTPLPQEEQQESEGEAVPGHRTGSNLDQLNTDKPADPNKEGSSAEYPKKMYHPDHPGGIGVMNADMERDYLERGWSLTPPKRNYKPPSAALEEEAKPVGSIKPSSPSRRADVKKKETD